MNSICNCQSSIPLHLDARAFATIVDNFTKDLGLLVTKEMAVVT